MFSRTYKTVVTAPPLVWVAVFLLGPYLLMVCEVETDQKL